LKGEKRKINKNAKIKPFQLVGVKIINWGTNQPNRNNNNPKRKLKEPS